VIAGEVQKVRGVDVGRSAVRLRNPANAARPWVQQYLDAAKILPPPEVDSRVVDLGDRVGLVVPIRLAKPCVSCHGPPEAIDATVRETLRQAYPADQATGFAVGDLRGVFWAEAAKTVPTPAP
jgi:hypothetical protein